MRPPSPWFATNLCNTMRALLNDPFLREKGRIPVEIGSYSIENKAPVGDVDLLDNGVG